MNENKEIIANKEITSKDTILTGIKPTDIPHLGNYLGAILPGLQMCEKAGRSLLFIADYHALIGVHDPKVLKSNNYSVAASWLACGLDPKKTIIYRQSDIPEIFELTWILNCMSPKGLLNRAHAYKAKIQDNQNEGKEDLDFGVSMGLFSYPVLMAADILLFDTTVVPVGEDQVQHIEIARDIAQKMNRTFGEVLKVPRFHLALSVSLPGIDGRKMSKSYGNHIPLFEDEKKLRKLVMKIKTDSLPPEAPKETKDNIVFDIFKLFASPDQTAELAKDYQKGIGWGVAKERLFELLLTKLKAPAARYNELINDTTTLDQILSDGASRAREMARPVLNRVRASIGVK
jgi:tryptophanyl-tRNA synthetase